MVDILTVGAAPGRDYTTLQAAINALAGNLPAPTEIHVFAENGQTEFAEAIVVQGSILTTPTNNLLIRAGEGSEHTGARGTGVVVNAPPTTASFRIDAEYTTIRGLEITRSGSTNAPGVQCNVEGCVLDRLLVYGHVGASGAYGIRLSGSPSRDLVVQNCAVFANAADGVFCEAFGGTVDHVLRLLNTTMYGNTGRGVRLQAVSSGEITVVTRNLIVAGNGGDDWSELSSTGTIIGDHSHNGSSDGTIPGEVANGSPTDSPPTSGTFFVFEDLTSGAEDFRLVRHSTNVALAAGIGPSIDALVPVFDFLGTPRSGPVADLGAHEGTVVPIVVPQPGFEELVSSLAQSQASLYPRGLAWSERI